MKLKLLALISFLTLAACKQNAQTVVVVGDSWASYVCAYKSLDKALLNAGIEDAGTNSTCAATTLVGVRADEWLGNKFHQATLVALKDSSVKVLYLSIGGNDVLNYWNKNMNMTQENAVLDKVASNIEAIIKEYQTARPDIKIILSGYDFPRFTADHPIKQYKEAYEDMGKPTPFELNSAVLRFSARVSKLADQKNIFYIQHYGLMHYYLGNSENNLPAFRTLAPEFISTPNSMTESGGDVQMQSDAKAMAAVTIQGNVVVTDAFHLSKFGYEKVAEHTVFHYLKEWLKH